MSTSSRTRTLVIAGGALVLAGLTLFGLLGLRHRRATDQARAGRNAATMVWPEEGRVRVEVLNAAGRAGLAREATRRLRSRGFDVVYFGNAEEFGRDSSVVIARTGDLDTAADVAGALGIERVRSEPDADLLLEVTVVLGMDWPPQDPDGSHGFGHRLTRTLRRLAGESN